MSRRSERDTSVARRARRQAAWRAPWRGRAAGLLAVVLVAGVVGAASVASAASVSSLVSAVAAPSAGGAGLAGAQNAVPTADPGRAVQSGAAAQTTDAGPGATPHTGAAAPGPIGTPTAAPAQTSAGGSTGAPTAGSDRSGAGAASVAGWLHTDGATIEREDGSPFVIKAIAWFGMETSNCAPHGLWSISLDAGLAQIASMGFNTIRLPFSNECLAAAHSTSIDANANPGLVDLSPLQLMDVVVQSAKGYGLSVILDRHRPDSGAQSELWYTDRFSEATWIADWTMLAERYASEPAVIGFDLHNEPHGTACWGCGDEAVDWRAAATRAGDAVLAVNPRLLIVVEGVEQQGDGSRTWWGGGLADVAAAPVALSVADRVVYSPHDYPASIFSQAWFAAADYPANLPGVWDANWGYLVTENIAPVLVGEFGTKLQTASDRAWLGALVDYLAVNALSFSYWSFNPNSGDTGGIVQDDWVTPQAEKLAALAPVLGEGAPVVPRAPVAPGAGDGDGAGPGGGAGPESGSGTPAPGAPRPSGEPTPLPSVAPDAPGTIGGSAGPGPIGGASGSPTPSGSPATPNVPPPAVPPAVPPPAVPPSTGSLGDLSASWALQSEWQAGYVAEVSVTNSGGSSGWSVSWPDPNATVVVNSWGMDCAVKAKTVTCTGTDWARYVAPGETVTAGVQLDSTSAPRAPVLTLVAG
ncbi:cellulase family glycosylhydrolase [Herbiconiux daphne]|uniref:cellulase n=1 Tax=Herbiconiux daphne TaxID=2970914 RepID=A0ABT2H168_9MICO|nr:cellulase family glycosylhydrolase [Herbiconiux daphne]MCS5733661.1 cellulase family glycosylhydrolase [Herbiconiux daphne]